MTHADINDLETRDYIFKIGDRAKGIQARYDADTDTLIFPRAGFDYVYELLKEALSQELKTGKWIEHPEIETSTPEYLMFYECSECGDKQCFYKSDIHKKRFCTYCGAKLNNSK